MSLGAVAGKESSSRPATGKRKKPAPEHPQPSPSTSKTLSKQVSGVEKTGDAAVDVDGRVHVAAANPPSEAAAACQEQASSAGIGSSGDQEVVSRAGPVEQKAAGVAESDDDAVPAPGRAHEEDVLGPDQLQDGGGGGEQRGDEARQFYWKDVVVVHDGEDWVARVLGAVKGKKSMYTLDFGDEVGHYDYYEDELRLARPGEAKGCTIPVVVPSPPVEVIPDRSGGLPAAGSKRGAHAAPVAAGSESARVVPASVVVRHRLPQDKLELLRKQREAAKRLQLKAALLAPSPHCSWYVYVIAIL